MSRETLTEVRWLTQVGTVQRRSRAGCAGVRFVARRVRDGVSAARPTRAMEIAARARLRAFPRRRPRSAASSHPSMPRSRNRRRRPPSSTPARRSTRCASSRICSRRRVRIRTWRPRSNRSPSEPRTRSCTVVHGDISPKNILLGARGPVFLDAECAWFGDPAFDLAFCLNHLLLKTLWVPSAERELLASFDALTRGVSSRRRLGACGSAGGSAPPTAARVVPRAHRWQVACRVSDR